MKKETLRAAVVAVAVLIAYNLAVFMIPCVKTAVFWLSWAFTLLAFAVAGYAIYGAFIKNPNAKSRFYGFPIARIGVIYVVLQTAVGGVFMALGLIIPWWLATVVYAIGFALAVIGLVSAESVVEEIQQQDEKLKKDVSAMRALQSQVGAMAANCDSPALKALAEELRYSDPVSSEATEEAETEMKALLDTMQQAVVDGEEEAVETLCRKAKLLLAERNRLCKLNK